MNNFPAVSVILPAYNAERFLKDSIDSILNQTFKDFELIILNDGSTDRTEDIILSYSDPRIRYVKNEQNLKLIKTLNKGIDLARGKYIARMDADDISLPTRFEKQVKYLETHDDIEMVGALAYMMKEDGTVTHVSRHYVTFHPDACQFASMFECQFVHPVCMLRAGILKKLRYSESEKAMHSEDRELWSRMYLEGCRMSNIQEPLLKYRVVASSICNKYKEIQCTKSMNHTIDSLNAFKTGIITELQYQDLFNKKTIGSYWMLMKFVDNTKREFFCNNARSKELYNEINVWEAKFLMEHAMSFKTRFLIIPIIFIFKFNSIFNLLTIYKKWTTNFSR